MTNVVVDRDVYAVLHLLKRRYRKRSMTEVLRIVLEGYESRDVQRTLREAVRLGRTLAEFETGAFDELEAQELD
jgi:hypothetical protein